MSDRRDDGPLRVPPERDVTPQLRARVLYEAMREHARPARSPARIGPVLAGLAAAAVVVGVVVTWSIRPGGGGTPASNQGAVGQAVAAHDVVDTVVKIPGDAQVGKIQDRCKRATGVDATYRMTTERLRSPLGRVAVGAYAEKGSKAHTQIFCTPFASFTSVPKANIVTALAPVKLIADSRVQGIVPSRSGGSSYVDGAWFAVAAGVKSIEVRLVVDGQSLPWHATQATHAYLFASTWAPLSDQQLSGQVTVEYRAISVDDTLLPIPSAIGSSMVTPAATQQFDSQRGHFPSISE